MNQPRVTLAAGMQVTPSVRLLSPLGAGGMGAVWLADNTALNTRVVVKFMLENLDSSTSARTRFKREAEAASQVKSPHVVQTFDYGLTPEGVPFIVMEHLEGRDLGAEIAARGALEPVMVITIVAQVAKALSKAHAAGLLHRDIKPDNIFLCHGEAEDELFVKLLDFGIAKTHAANGEAPLDTQTKTGQVIGTPFYMSPEQVTAQKVIDLRSDLWSLGIVAYEALTGKRPFDGPSFGALAVKIATGEPPKPSDENPALPPSVDAWFAQACARDPAARFASARELADRLRASFEGVVSLPPAISGSMSDSGPRGGAVSGSRPTIDAKPATAVGSVPAGPISVDDDAHARPSFVLASTLSQDPSTGDRGDPSALARSEPGRAAVGIGDRAEGPATVRHGPQGKARVVLPLAAFAIITGAIAVGWKAKEHSGDDRGSSAPATNMTNVATAPPPPSTPETATTASAAPALSAVVHVAADAATPASASGAAPASAPTHANPPVVTHSDVKPPIKPTASAPSTKPVETPPHPSARPNTDPLF